MMSGLAAAYSVTTTGTAPLSGWKTRAPPPRVAFQRQRRMSMTTATATATCMPREAMTAPEKADVLRSLDGWAESNLLPLLKPVDQLWQPHDLLPDSASGSARRWTSCGRARGRSPTTTTSAWWATW